MASLRPVGRSAATLDKDRKSLCRFSFADGCQCRTPRASHHPHVVAGRNLSRSRRETGDKSSPPNPFSCNTYGSPRKCCKQKTYAQD